MSLQSHRPELLKGVNDLIAGVIKDPLSVKPFIVREQHTLSRSKEALGSPNVL